MQACTYIRTTVCLLLISLPDLGARVIRPSGEVIVGEKIRAHSSQVVSGTVGKIQIRIPYDPSYLVLFERVDQVPHLLRASVIRSCDEIDLSGISKPEGKIEECVSEQKIGWRRTGKKPLIVSINPRIKTRYRAYRKAGEVPRASLDTSRLDKHQSYHGHPQQ